MFKIFALLAVLAVLACAVSGLLLFRQLQNELNKKRTESARAARWKERNENGVNYEEENESQKVNS